ncbi:hypothetical protein [Acinetobacter pseudolwoffii]|nr:hypothetical protein [Acinetobacter pseudolwoffii]
MLSIADLKIAIIALRYVALVGQWVEQSGKVLIIDFYTYQKYMGCK